MASLIQIERLCFNGSTCHILCFNEIICFLFVYCRIFLEKEEVGYKVINLCVKSAFALH